MNEDQWAQMRHTLETERGVCRDVAEARPYVWYDRGDTTTVYADGRWSDMDPSQRGTVFTRAVNLSSGIIITKHPVPGARRSVLPQVRPDRPVRNHLSRKEKEGHLHGEMHPTARKWHIRGKLHLGEDPDAPHSHVEDGLAKYLLTPKPYMEWEQKHTHGPGQPTERHWHFQHRDGELWAASDADPRLVERVVDPARAAAEHLHRRRNKDPRESPEKRLDMNPLAAAMLAEADTVFFSIEGSIKADALLSAGECAFAVPSVTMWSTEELEQFAEDHLAGKQVFVVPDADWYQNPLVATQAFLCADYLRQHGVRGAAVAASPREKGVDDYLAAGGLVDDLKVIERVLPPAFGKWQARIEREGLLDPDRPGKMLTAPGLRGYVTTVRLLAMLADETGRVIKPGRDLLKYVGISPKRLEAALRRMTLDEALGEFVLGGTTNWPPPVLLEGSWAIDARWWQETPVYRVRKDLRARTVDEGATVGRKRGP